MYHGPREQIMDFFNMMGFSLPARKDPASFLQEVTSVKDQEVSGITFKYFATPDVLCSVYRNCDCHLVLHRYSQVRQQIRVNVKLKGPAPGL